MNELVQVHCYIVARVLWVVARALLCGFRSVLNSSLCIWVARVLRVVASIMLCS